MADIVFYTNPQSRGRIAHWMLEELGEPYETRWLSYGGEMKTPQYLAVNPMGKVPAIVHKSGNAVVTEAAAICAYLAAAYPSKGLVPRGLAPEGGGPSLADFHRWMFFAAGPLEMAVTARTMKWEAAPEQSSMLGFGNYGDTVNAVETHLADREFVCGGNFSAADVYLGSQIIWGMRFGSIEPREAFKNYTDRLIRRPAYKRAEQICGERAAEDGE